MVKVRFAPSPTGALHLGSALTAFANRSFADEHGGTLLLRIDDTDTARADPSAEKGILRDLEWLGIAWDEGPVRQSERALHYEQAAETLLALGAAEEDRDGALRFVLEGRPTLVRADGRATYHLASVVDDAAFDITHVIRGKDLEPVTPIHRALHAALKTQAPEYVHHGLLLGPDGAKLSKRHGAASVADLRETGIPAEAVRGYLAELDLPRHDVHFDEARLRRLAVDAIGAMSDEELAERVGGAPELVPVMRGARDLVEARRYVDLVLSPPRGRAGPAGRETLARFRELRARANGDLSFEQAKEIVRELKAVGGDLRALRVALTGVESGPELAAVIAALPAEEALRRVDEAL
jgi:glutamyl/glutaminyl-tRNA synthetase